MILGLSGKKGSGKDTAYGFIKEWADHHEVFQVRRDAFADRLKLSAARIAFPEAILDEALDWCNTMKESGTLVFEIPGRVTHKVSGREFLQRYGTEAHRDIFGMDFWLNPIRTDYLLNPNTLTVITDVRFDNEAELIRSLGGEVWVIHRPGFDDGDGHASEKPLTERLVDRTITNDRGLDRFNTRVQLQIERLSL